MGGFFLWAFVPLAAAAGENVGVPRGDIERIAVALGGEAQTFVDVGNGKRCDIVWGRYVIVVSHARRWEESVGRCLTCGVRLRKDPALLLLVVDRGDWRHVREAAVVARRYRVAVEVVEPKGETLRADLGVPPPVNVNTATAEELEALPGVGPTLAARIVAERTKRAFSSPDDLARVRGIGKKTVDDLRDQITVE